MGYLRGLVMLAAVGWALGPRAFDPALLIAAVATTALASLRSQLEGVDRREAVAAHSSAPPVDPAHPFSEIHPRGWFG